MAYTDDTQLPYSELEAQRWGRALESSQRALEQSMDSPAYRDFRNNNASVWGRDVQDSLDIQETQGSLTGTMRGGGNSSSIESPSSDTTVKLDNGFKERYGSYTGSPISRIEIATSETGATHGSVSTEPDVSSSPDHQSLAGVESDSPLRPHFRDPSQTQGDRTRYSLPIGRASPTQIHPKQIQNETSRTSARFLPFPNGTIIPVPKSLSHRQSGFPGPLGSPVDLHPRRGPNLHQQKLDARVSSLPSIPSPLGPGYMQEKLQQGHDGDELLASERGRPLHKSESRQNRGDGEMKDNWKRTPVRQSPTVQQYASSGSIDSPMFDIYPRSAEIGDEGNLTLGRSGYANGSGHARKHTDPFVDHQDIQYGTGFGTRECGTTTFSDETSMGGASMPFEPFADSRMCGTSMPVQDPPITRGCGSTTDPFPLSAESFDLPPHTPFRVPWPYSAAATSGFAVPPIPTGSQGRPPLRSNLPIPPPPLSCIEGQYQKTPEARARLEAWEPIREAWIRTEAEKIAQLAKLKHAMERRYQETRSNKDYEAWQNLQAAYEDATNLEKRQEERRNLFLKEKKMEALKTDNAEDVSAASRSTVAAGGEEKLLGFKMALMERECAEVKPDEEQTAITAEMLATLTPEEKKALRKHLVTRLERKS
jgi:hypothetical protein